MYYNPHIVIVTLCNGKGGSGKTTLAILLASALGEAGYDAAVLDTDVQKTATHWLEATREVQLAVDGKQYGALFIDTAPRLDSKRLISSVRRADLVVVVSSPPPADLFTSRDTTMFLERESVKDRARLLFNQVQTGTIVARELEEMAERIGLDPLKNLLHRRQAYQHAVMLGWKSLPPEAREEVLKTAPEITALAKKGK